MQGIGLVKFVYGRMSLGRRGKLVEAQFIVAGPRYTLALRQLGFRPCESVVTRRLLSQAAMPTLVGKILPESSS